MQAPFRGLEVKYEYDRYNVTSKLWQEWTGVVTTSSPNVQYTYSFPTDGTTGLRRTLTTYRGGKVIKDRPGMGTFYRSQHELVFVFKNGEERHRNHFELGQHGRTRSNVWSYPSIRSVDPAEG